MYVVKILILILCSTIYKVTQAACLAYKPAFNLMSQRAMLLKDVAADKYVTHKSAYDATQELKVLNNVDKLANSVGLDNYSVMLFAQIQMDMSKQIEEYWLDIWNKNPSLAPKPGQYKGLTVVRSQIQVIDKQLYPALAKVPKNQCSTYNIQEEFKSGFSQVQGIPTTPDFSMLMINSVLSIKAK